MKSKSKKIKSNDAKLFKNLVTACDIYFEPVMEGIDLTDYSDGGIYAIENQILKLKRTGYVQSEISAIPFGFWFGNAFIKRFGGEWNFDKKNLFNSEVIIYKKGTKEVAWIMYPFHRTTIFIEKGNGDKSLSNLMRGAELMHDTSKMKEELKKAKMEKNGWIRLESGDTMRMTVGKVGECHFCHRKDQKLQYEMCQDCYKEHRITIEEFGNGIVFCADEVSGEEWFTTVNYGDKDMEITL